MELCHIGKVLIFVVFVCFLFMFEVVTFTVKINTRIPLNNESTPRTEVSLKISDLSRHSRWMGKYMEEKPWL